MILDIIHDKLRLKLKKIALIIDDELKTIFHDAITNSKEYKSLKGEKNLAGGESLLGHFGFDDGGAKVDAIVNKWVSNIHSEVFLRKTNTKLEAGIQVYTINKTFKDVLGMAEAVQDTSKAAKAGLLRTPKAYSVLIPWLRDLLFEGDKTLLTEHTITFNPKSLSTSRSKQAIMIKSRTKKWHVPSEVAGTEEDNWIIRVLEKDIYPKMEGVIESTVIKTI
jgi:hypothetical protein